MKHTRVALAESHYSTRFVEVNMTIMHH